MCEQPFQRQMDVREVQAKNPQPPNQNVPGPDHNWPVKHQDHPVVLKRWPTRQPVVNDRCDCCCENHDVTWCKCVARTSNGARALCLAANKNISRTKATLSCPLLCCELLFVYNRIKGNRNVVELLKTPVKMCNFLINSYYFHWF